MLIKGNLPSVLSLADYKGRVLLLLFLLAVFLEVVKAILELDRRDSIAKLSA
jgi:hypothetical protein